MQIPYTKATLHQLVVGAGARAGGLTAAAATSCMCTEHRRGRAALIDRWAANLYQEQ